MFLWREVRWEVCEGEKKGWWGERNESAFLQSVVSIRGLKAEEGEEGRTLMGPAAVIPVPANLVEVIRRELVWMPLA